MRIIGHVGTLNIRYESSRRYVVITLNTDDFIGFKLIFAVLNIHRASIFHVFVYL